jgi:hypothetical protein
LAAANQKRRRVARDRTGVSGRAMRDALLDGQTDPTPWAAVARGQRRAQRPDVARARDGRCGAPHRCLVAARLTPMDARAAGMERLRAAIAPRRAPPSESTAPPAATAAPGALTSSPPPRAVGRTMTEPGAVGVDRATGVILTAADWAAAPVARLDPMPGVGRAIAAAILAAGGRDRSRCPTAARLAAGAGRGPGHDESAGQRRRGKPRQGAPWRRTRRIEAAHAASPTQDPDLAAPDRRMAARRGKQTAIVAVAPPIRIIASHILRDGTIDRESGGTDCDERDRGAMEQRLGRRLEQLGNPVTLPSTAA